MPELPEVETVVRDLRPLLVGATLTQVRVGKHSLRRSWQPDWSEAVAGATVQAIRRRGKWILVDLESPRTLLIHLGMTGQLTVEPAPQPLQSHTHLIFSLHRGDELRFRDIRRFGSVELYCVPSVLKDFLAARLGPEPDELTVAQLAASLQATDRPVKAVLLDQRVVAGVGNIYADEALFRAGIHPEQRGRTLDPAAITRLHGAIGAVITEAIAGRGSTIRDYVGGSGLAGSFQDRHNVYGRTDQPCSSCSEPVRLVRIAGRSSHFCPRCQPPPPGAGGR
jgi:formamidopyrimidine-DNA glycosylase